MPKNNRKCKTCGKEYYFCPSCDEGRFKPLWYGMFCCENCKKIFDILSGIGVGRLTASAAKRQLNKCDLSGRKKFEPMVKKKLDELYTSPKKEIVKEIEE